MKKVYSKPLMEIEVYELNADIAANCGTVVTLGPEITGVPPCEYFKEAYDEIPMFMTFAEQNRSFYQDGSGECDCYYTSGREGFFTS